MQALSNIVLTAGGHSDPAAGLCVMEAVALFVGEPHGDWPDCVCPVLIEFGRVLNDTLPDRWRTNLLLPLVPLLVGTRDPASTGDPFSPSPLEQQRAEALVAWCVNSFPGTRAAQGRAEEVAEALAEATDNRRWRYARHAARAAAWAVASAVTMCSDYEMARALRAGASPAVATQAALKCGLSMWREAVAAYRDAALLERGSVWLGGSAMAVRAAQAAEPALSR